MREIRSNSLVLLLLFTLLPLCDLSAQKANKQNITMEAKNEAMASVFKRLEKVSPYKVLFTYRDIENYKVTLKVKNASIDRFMQAAIGNRPLTYKVDGNIVYLKKNKGTVLLAPDGNILHGKVLDENGEPLIGATIQIKGKGEGTTTNMDGEYTLTTKQTSGIVTFSYVGYKTEQFPIEDVVGMKSVRLTPNTQISDVVVTGFFDKQKNTFTGSFNKISHDEIAEFGTANIFTVLQNLDPSFKIKENNSAGSNPNKLPDFVVRGESSFQSGSSLPAIIVDGYEVDVQYLYDMDLERIESITILKDASATVYYGSRAANGVLIIETRRPKPGQLRVSYSNRTGITWADLTSYNLMNARQKLEFERLSGIYTSDNPQQQYQLEKTYEQLKRNVERGIDTYWLSQPLHTALTQNHSIYAEGGDNVITYGLSGSYNNNQGIMKGSGRSGYSLTFDLGYRVKEKLKIRNSFSYSYTKGKNSPYGSFSNFSSANPYSPIYDEQGRYIKVYTQHPGQNHYNYLYNGSLPHRDWDKSQTMLEQLDVDYRITPSLRWKTTVSYSRSTGESQSYTSPNDAQFASSNLAASDKGRATSAHSEETGWDFSSTLANNFVFGKHSLYVGGGVNFSENKTYDESYSVMGFIDDRFNEIGNANAFSTDSKPVSAHSTSRLAGFLGNINYSYDNRYFLDLSGRLDGSSAYGSDNRFGNNWSVGAGWNINNEKWMKGVIPFLDEFRLRASYGLTGASNFSQNVARTMFQFNQQALYYETLGATFIQYGNTHLTWQQNKQFNVGLDFALANRRLNLTMNYYVNRVNGLLLPVTVAPSLGFSEYTENFGEIENSGYDINFNAVLIRTKDFDWALSFSGAHNKNIIKKINDALRTTNESNSFDTADADEAKTRPVTEYEEGQSMNVIKVVPSLGINPSNGKELYLTKDGKVTEIWNSDDKVAVGTTDPKLSGTFGTNFVYKQWTLSATFYYSYGAKTYNGTLASRVEGLNIYENGDARAFEERWKKPGDLTFYKNIADHTTSYASSRFVQDENYLTLSNVALFYRFPKSWLKPLGVDQIKLGMNMSDVFYTSTVKQERGLDYPYSRTISFSLNISF
jgi:TonB-linked SusC/RagA family outer membrane protein